MQHFDCFIVGQGLAGTVLAHILEKAGKSVLIFDNKQTHPSSSDVAAGVINPVTGMRFVKTWRVDEFLPFARHFYSQIEKDLGTKLWFEKNIFRTVNHTEDKNNYFLRRSFEEYKVYCGEISDADALKLKTYFQPQIEFVKLTNAAQVNIQLLLYASKTRWQNKDQYIETNFDPHLVEFEKEIVCYRNFSAQKIIFAEGAHAINNIFFDDLKFVLDKGEAVTIGVDNYKNEDIVKDLLSVVPQYTESGEIKNYWIGATNAWIFEDEKPTAEKKIEILEKLNQLIQVDYQFENHLAAIRPTTKDRKPFLGASKKNEKVFIFNGLGSKGSLLAPFWALHLVKHIFQNTPLERSVDVNRFF